MRKYTEQIKIAAASDYCSGQLGLKTVARRHGVDVSSLRKWVSAYRIHGAAGLRRKRRRYHSVESRLLILNRMRDDGLSYRKTAALFGIANFNILKKWEQQHLVSSCSARALHSSAARETITERTKNKSKAQRHEEAHNLQDLLTELNQLRMENAFLKKLNALAQANKQSAQEDEHKPC